MLEKFCPRLCAGTFFAILLKYRPNATVKKMNSSQKSNSEPAYVEGLIQIAKPDFKIQKVNEESFKTSVSKFKKCKKGTKLAFISIDDPQFIDSFDKLVKSNYHDALMRTYSFFNGFNYNVGTEAQYTAAALLELIRLDTTIPKNQLFYADDSGTPINKIELLARRKFNYPALILGIWHYIIVNVTDNSVGEQTYVQLLTPPAHSDNEDTVNSSIGSDRVDFIEVTNEKLTVPSKMGTASAIPVKLNSDESDDKVVVPNAPQDTEGVKHNEKNELLLELSANFRRSLEKNFEDIKKYNPSILFDRYLCKAKNYYSTKKTLLYREVPHPFYELYVASDLRMKMLASNVGPITQQLASRIKNADVSKLRKLANCIIIQGTGGIGKSMLMQHLLLSSIEQFDDSGFLPVLLNLRDYRTTIDSLLDFICQGIKEFDESIKQEDVLALLQNKKMVILLDGLDEIYSKDRNSFEKKLESFIKSYPDNMIVISSRPTNSFVSYTTFAVYDLLPLNREQAVELTEKLEFWDVETKADFVKELKGPFFKSYYQFTSNPLLLTIMLMTYSSFGPMPEKIHIFYKRAYETMARLHDQTKGTYQRPLNTKLTPEEFAKFFSYFCAFTYVNEQLEFTELDFSKYMKRALKGTNLEQSETIYKEFLLDLTVNLCIMYKEGEKYYFIHRSFQEYFAAVCFASDDDSSLYDTGMFFEKSHRLQYDKTFPMLCDMIPEKVERYIFLPFLQSKFEQNGDSVADEYWNFLEQQYPIIFCEKGEVGQLNENIVQSFLLETIIREKKLGYNYRLGNLKWPDSLFNQYTTNWAVVYEKFLHDSTYDDYPDPNNLPDSLFEEVTLYPVNCLPKLYEIYCGKPQIVGTSTEIEIEELLEEPNEYKELIAFMEDDNFPLKREYLNIKSYYLNLKNKNENQPKTFKWI